MSDEICSICTKPIKGCFVGMGSGKVAHHSCYEKENPPRVALTLYNLARGAGDPVLAAEVIADFVPAELGIKMVEEFNRRLMIQWRKRCED